MTIIIGGGWAGLAVAIELARHHIPVTLLESATQLGGRARTVNYHGIAIDNGQHLMLGAYHETLRLLKIIGVKESQVFDRHPLNLRLHQRGYPDTRFRFPALPAPLHVISGLVLAEGISFQDRWRALKMCNSLISTSRNLVPDITVLDLLTQKKQGDRIIRTLWQPLCLAILNTHIETASAEIFFKSLQDAFIHGRSDSDLLYARTNLGNILPEPARRYIEQQGGSVKLQHRVTRLAIEKGKITGVELSNGEFMPAEYVILAVPPSNCRDLLMQHAIMSDIVANLAQMEYSPICTVYLQYPESTRLSNPMAGLIGTLGQWIFDRSGYGREGLMAVVISGNGEHMHMDNDTLCKRIVNEIADVFPSWPEPLERFVIREKRATFTCRKGINTIRPATTTPVVGCLLAGDYTATEYPATLEGAVRSGIKAAHQVVKLSGASVVLELA